MNRHNSANIHACRQNRERANESDRDRWTVQTAEALAENTPRVLPIGMIENLCRPKCP
jgi:hypothetical protein